MENAKTYLVPLGRLLLASLFICSGFGKLMNPSGTAQYFASMNIPVPSIAVWIAIISDSIGGILILIVFQPRWVALLLEIFCLVAGFAIRLRAGDLPNMI